jgi:hypothetical protein
MVTSTATATWISLILQNSWASTGSHVHDESLVDNAIL